MYQVYWWLEKAWSCFGMSCNEHSISRLFSSCVSSFKIILFLIGPASDLLISKYISPFWKKDMWESFVSRKSYPIRWVRADLISKNTYCPITFPGCNRIDSDLNTDTGWLDIPIICTETLLWRRRQGGLKVMGYC